MMRGNQHTIRMERTCGRRTLTLMFILSASLSKNVCGGVPTKIPIAPEPVGSGARALGQSAFIAVADDATAASWNPAGLINLERPEVSFVGAWKSITTDPSSRESNVSYDHGGWNEGQINFMSYAYPLKVCGTDTVLSVNYHQVYDLGIEQSYDVSGTDPHRFEGRSRGAISAYSLAGGLSMPSCPQVTVGASFNWYTKSLLNHYVRQVENRQWALSDTNDSLTLTETIDGLCGHNFTFGLLWDAYERQENLLTLGFVCQTPFTAEVDWKLVEDVNVTYPRQRLDIGFPLSLGAGMNYRFSDEFSTALDVQWTDWSEYKYTDAQSTPNGDALAVRLGFERLWFSEPSRQSVFAWRGGVFYEPRPAWSGILPVYGFSLGLGWTLKAHFSLDFAYQFRWGEGDDFTSDGITYFDYGVEEHFLVTSLITYF